ncbi:MAG: glutathione S-transferase family protein [Pseudomonadota bacterium]
MADAPYVLYGHPESRSKLVEHVLVELGLDYDHQTIDFKHGGHRTPAFLAINPAGWIPALRMPDGTVLTETAAINLTLAERHHCADGTSLVPALPDPLRAEFFALLFHITGMLEPALKRLWYPTRYAGGPANEGAVVVDAKRDIFSTLDLLEDILSRRGPNVLGHRFSLVDITLAYWFRCVAHLPEATALRHIRACADRVYARPALQRFAGDAARMIEVWEST